MCRGVCALMGGYLYALAVAAVVISVVSALVPASMSTHVRALCALCVICLVCAPLASAIGALTKGDWEIPEGWLGEDAEQVPKQDYGEFSRELLAGQLTLLLEKEFSLSQSDVQVYAAYDADGSLTRVTLVLSGKAIWQDPAPIKAYVKNLLGCECVIVLD